MTVREAVREAMLDHNADTFTKESDHEWLREYDGRSQSGGSLEPAQYELYSIVPAPDPTASCSVIRAMDSHNRHPLFSLYRQQCLCPDSAPGERCSQALVSRH